MATNQKQDFAVSRVNKYNRSTVINIEKHNERKNQNYSNVDIDINRSHLNVHFKEPCDTYIKTFDKMCEDGLISTKGLKSTASIIDEMMLDVNSSYFERKANEKGCTGYDFAKEFFKNAYDFAVKEAGGEQYVLSAIMHADERNSELSGKLGKDIYHYHLHVVFIPVVQKEIKWSKRCKDKSLIGTVKEVITQVSHSKKWASKLVEDENGKKYLERSYSLLQDRFPDYMQSCGYTDVGRGEKGSTEKHLSATQFKTKKEKENLQKTMRENEKVKIELEKNIEKKVKIQNVENIEVKPILFDKERVSVRVKDWNYVKSLAKRFILYVNEQRQLKSENENLKSENESLKLQNKKLIVKVDEKGSVLKNLENNKKLQTLEQLEKFKENVYKFLEMFGLKKHFEEFLKNIKNRKNEIDR